MICHIVYIGNPAEMDSVVICLRIRNFDKRGGQYKLCWPQNDKFRI